MTAGSWKITKIRRSLFHQFSWPRGHENSQKSGDPFYFNFHDPVVMKIHKNQAVSFWNDRVPQGIWNDRVPRRIWEDHLPPNLLIKFHLSSLKSKKVGKKHALCAPCAPTVRPLCTPCATLVQFPKKSTVWPLRNLGPFEIDLGYCSTRSKDTAPQNQKILLHTQRKSWWDTAPQVSKDTAPHFKKKVKDTAPPPFLGDFQNDGKFSAGW